MEKADFVHTTECIVILFSDTQKMIIKGKLKSSHPDEHSTFLQRQPDLVQTLMTLDRRCTNVTYSLGHFNLEKISFPSYFVIKRARNALESSV